MSRTDPIPDLQARLAALVDPASRAWWERYLGGAAAVRGVRMDRLREAVHEWHQRHELAGLGADGEFGLAIELIREPLAEDKLAGILVLQDLLVPRKALRWRTALPVWAGLFADGAIADRNACDWLALRVLGPVALGAGQRCARAVAAWSKTDNVWQQRASVVSFADGARSGDENFRGFAAMVLAACSRVVKNQERDAQSAVAWVLRELSVVEPGKVDGFVVRNFALMSPEAVRAATRKLPAD